MNECRKAKEFRAFRIGDDPIQRSRSLVLNIPMWEAGPAHTRLHRLTIWVITTSYAVQE